MDVLIHANVDVQLRNSKWAYCRFDGVRYSQSNLHMLHCYNYTQDHHHHIYFPIITQQKSQK